MTDETNTTYGFFSDYDSAGIYKVTVIVSNGILTENRTWILNVTNVNRKPTAMISSPVDNEKFSTEDTIYFDATDSFDLDNDSITYTWTSSIDGNIGNSATFTRKLSSGTHTITLTIDDGNGGTDREQITITVNKPSGKKGLIPGFEILSLLSALCICILLLKRKD